MLWLASNANHRPGSMSVRPSRAGAVHTDKAYRRTRAPPLSAGARHVTTTVPSPLEPRRNCGLEGGTMGLAGTQQHS